ncbi:Na+/H+ antiporter subunit E [Aureimonas fodinaquatilis]|uniref:Na+/H+ antiporter subunit E n=1 Tax=Aureimonas fodinaquatilis TaxID=2565783 RepID=A0A5B0DZU6_9HYPH|nr:Na+/H+ antiporter subunit E [Aureimonas fodinaquatilis]KAA0972307.1 Na+/H+ antiporter subunit E [Aureimonas fodinaquatilis]
MTLFVVNIVLALVWVIVTAAFSLTNLVFGFILSAFTLGLIREQIGTGGYVRRSGRVASLIFYLFTEIFVSAWRVAVAALRPKLDLKPGVFIYRMMVDRDYEIAMLSSLVGLTPGSLVLDVSEDHTTLFIHALDCTDPDAERRRIARGFERKLLEALR